MYFRSTDVSPVPEPPDTGETPVLRNQPPSSPLRVVRVSAVPSHFKADECTLFLHSVTTAVDANPGSAILSRRRRLRRRLDFLT
jgi:hypothetical protein